MWGRLGLLYDIFLIVSTQPESREFWKSVLDMLWNDFFKVRLYSYVVNKLTKFWVQIYFRCGRKTWLSFPSILFSILRIRARVTSLKVTRCFANFLRTLINFFSKFVSLFKNFFHPLIEPTFKKRYVVFVWKYKYNNVIV